MVQSEDESNWFHAQIDALRCATRKQLIKEFATVFQFPNYFGWNLDALDDCMADLAWLPAKNFRVQVINFFQLEQKEPDQAIYLRDMLSDIENYWEVKRLQAHSRDFQFRINYQ